MTGAFSSRNLRRQADRLRDLFRDASITVLNELLEVLPEPPEPRRKEETKGQCISRILGVGDTAAIATGTAAIEAGRANRALYPRSGFQGASVTSHISLASRNAFGDRRMNTRVFGTNNLGGAIGRGASKLSVASGYALLGLEAGRLIGAAQKCQ